MIFNHGEFSAWTVKSATLTKKTIIEKKGTFFTPYTYHFSDFGTSSDLRATRMRCMQTRLPSAGRG
jgi:hypothetical protein